MRVAIYYDKIIGRDDGNPRYVRECLNRMAAESIENAGKGATVIPLEVGWLAPKEDMRLAGTYDGNIWVDWGEDALAGLIPYKMVDCPRPSVYWASDTHLGYEYRLNMAKKFNHVFVAQKRAQEEFKRDGVEAEWLPHAFEPLVYHPFEKASKTYDVCFVGHINSQNRIDALDRLFMEIPNFFYGQRLFQAAAEKFCDSKIVFNISMLDDINMRTFEAMGTGSFLLTNWIPTIEELFEDGKHLVLYRSLDEMADKAKYYLAHDSERERIAAAGYEEVMKKHTIQHRVDRMLEVLDQKLLVGV